MYVCMYMYVFMRVYSCVCVSSYVQNVNNEI